MCVCVCVCVCVLCLVCVSSVCVHVCVRAFTKNTSPNALHKRARWLDCSLLSETAWAPEQRPVCSCHRLEQVLGSTMCIRQSTHQK
ncbi:hypothetical protein EDB81DRAFT_787114 [Dactylonectria macrodidyma]|uniref:Secreted protein n=1 Tax=Dactylonectria macrodidyma TaxID=307937 RepID=A0A9P9F9Q6_9HYPO|nr:hypothetical protein EDB81DRAFT_787114 [Dactylonectria macrodidyma]